MNSISPTSVAATSSITPSSGTSNKLSQTTTAKTDAEKPATEAATKLPPARVNEVGQTVGTKINITA